MIPVAVVPEPGGFDGQCRQRGQAWLDANPGKRTGFPAYWTEFQPELADGFQNRCGWWAMEIEDGAVDHYLSKWHHRDEAYQWHNYRYIAGSVNSSKGNHDNAMLDPFEVGEGWFEVLLPSMLLRRTDAVPEHLRSKADFTIRQLRLSTGIKVRRNRRRWYEAYKKWRADPNKGLTMGGLEEIAPLVAAAVKRWEATGQPLP